MSIFVIFRHMLQCPRSYSRAPCPFGAVVQPQGLVANCATEVVLGNRRNENMSVTFFRERIPWLQPLDKLLDIGAHLPLSGSVLADPSATSNNVKMVSRSLLELSTLSAYSSY